MKWYTESMYLETEMMFWTTMTTGSSDVLGFQRRSSGTVLGAAASLGAVCEPPPQLEESPTRILWSSSCSLRWCREQIPQVQADLNLFTYLGGGVSREKSGILSCVLNSMLTGTYTGSVLDSCVHCSLDLSVRHVSVGSPCESLYVRPQAHKTPAAWGFKWAKG